MLPALVAWFVPALHWFWDGMVVACSFDCFEAIGSLRHSLGEPSAATQLYHFSACEKSLWLKSFHEKKCAI